MSCLPASSYRFFPTVYFSVNTNVLFSIGFTMNLAMKMRL